ncbi:MAG TPA: type II toxin-antitoxin system RelE/ParE family toxin [Candidatus Kapabacteria bacterium]|nr:type II toxin-antitoxin system RelE/ParE family toxin [Candidatus Kapabacteria bacterium]
MIILPRRPLSTPGKVVSAFVDKAASLSDHPQPGKVVREVDDPNLREVSVHSWRMVSHLRNQKIYVVTLIHKRRNVGAEDI